MLCFAPTASAAISALPDYLLNALSATFSGIVTYEALPYSPYSALVNGEGARIVYAVSLNLRAVR